MKGKVSRRRNRHQIRSKNRIDAGRKQRRLVDKLTKGKKHYQTYGNNKKKRIRQDKKKSKIF